jgi:hypothetical protein
VSDYGTPEGVTAQEIFERVWNHFVVNGAPKSVRGRHCSYRGRGGNACAVGILVADSECRTWDRLTSPAVTNLFHAGRLPARLIPHVSLLVSLQSAHDSWYDRLDGEEREESLRRIARDFNLTVPS